MRPSEILEALLPLAKLGGLEVRRARAGGEAAVESNTCRVRDRVFVVLSDGDPLERQIDVLAAAIRDHARDALEHGYLPPAVRERLAGDAFD